MRARESVMARTLSNAAWHRECRRADIASPVQPHRASLLRDAAAARRTNRRRLSVDVFVTQRGASYRSILSSLSSVRP
ncbi:hypothetical protein ABU614_18245 [Lysobacter firmicutimachus]|uniref:Uncharacterized protein n=1 Tax=Lysobacter firmicutimachus TaxID=1792846 RepID=A0AAU8MPF0_9GAMM|nr:hypothetical protein [Lysobacter antibioticus]